MISVLSSQLGEAVTIFPKGKGSGYIKTDTREVYGIHNELWLDPLTDG